MNQEILELLQGHSANFLEMALEQDRFERIQQPDGYGKYSRECGDTLEIYLMMDGNRRIRWASFYTEGCIYTIACANALVHMIEGKSIMEARAISAKQIADFLETLPKAEMHCAELAVRALRLALGDLRETDRRPWSKFYRKV
jgi:nitrogen fixation NifU-like protein